MKAAGSGRAGRWGVSLRPLLLAGTPSGKPDQLSAGDTRAWWVGVPGSQVARAADCRLASLPDHTTHAWLLEVSLGTRLVKGPCLLSSLSLRSGVPPQPVKSPSLWRCQARRGQLGGGRVTVGRRGSLHMTRLPGGQLPVFPGGSTAGCLEPRTVGAHPLRSLACTQRSLEVPAVAGEKKGGSVPGRPWGGSGRAPARRLAETQGKRRSCKTEHEPEQSCTQTRGQEAQPRLLAGRSAARGLGAGALGLSAVRQARGVKARPWGAPISPSLSVVLCEMGMIRVSTLSRLSAAM